MQLFKDFVYFLHYSQIYIARKFPKRINLNQLVYLIILNLLAYFKVYSFVKNG